MMTLTSDDDSAAMHYTRHHSGVTHDYRRFITVIIQF